MKVNKPTLSRNSDLYKNNKELLRFELNHTTDPNVRLELTKLLVKIETREKRNKIIRWGILVIFFAIFFSFLYHRF